MQQIAKVPNDGEWRGKIDESSCYWWHWSHREMSGGVSTES